MLTESAIKKAYTKPVEGLTQLTDGRRLFLKFTRTVKGDDGKLAWAGDPSWRLDYTKPAGGYSTITLGTYPEVGSALARERAEEVRQGLLRNIDPLEARKEKKVEQAKVVADRKLIKAGLAPTGSFEQVAGQMLDESKNEWSASYHTGLEQDLRLRAYPAIGKLQCRDLDHTHFMALARGLKYGEVSVGGKPPKKDVLGAKRVLFACKRVMGFAMLNGLCDEDPFVKIGDISKKVGRSPQKKSRSAAITPEGITKIMQLFNTRPDFTRRLAWVNAQTFQRPVNVETMKWEDLSDLDGDRPLWTIPAGMMKRSVQDKEVVAAPHYVPLAKQTAKLILEQGEMQDRMGFKSVYVFPNRLVSKRAKYPVATGHLLEVMRFLLDIGKGEHTTHGFRATARTLGEEACHLDPRHLEAHLAHVKGIDLKDATSGMGRTYARVTFLDARFEMAQVWADYLDGLVYGKPDTLLPAPVTQVATAPITPAPAPQYALAA